MQNVVCLLEIIYLTIKYPIANHANPLARKNINPQKPSFLAHILSFSFFSKFTLQSFTAILDITTKETK